MWQIYDALIDTISDELTVIECLVGVSWTLVRSERGIGVAKTIKGGKKGTELCNIAGMSLKKLAIYLKSWNMLEATLGMAALNSALNTSANVIEMTGNHDIIQKLNHEFNAFAYLMPEIENKKVAVIGHFPGIEQLEGVCKLSILEREPQLDDFPDAACEYILPQQEVVFITGTAFINKTMPRLLELSSKAKVVIVGPSTPISKILYDFGVDTIAGMFVGDDEKMFWKTVQEGAKFNVFKRGGQMVCIQS